MFADLLRCRRSLINSPFHRRKNVKREAAISMTSGFAKVTLDDRIPALRVSRDGGGPYLVGISVEAVPAWRSWLVGTEAAYADDLLIAENIAVAEDLRRAASQYVNSVLQKHRALGDRYVTIRNEVWTQHTQDASAGGLQKARGEGGRR